MITIFSFSLPVLLSHMSGHSIFLLDLVVFNELLFVFISVGAHSSVFPEGNQYSYQFSNDVFIKDFKSGRPVAYRLIGTLKVVNILTADDAKLLRFNLDSPQLHVRPHGSSSQTEFFFHKSPLDNYKNNDFYAIWKLGNVSDIYYDANENVALTNIKKALVSLFQYQINDGDYTENRGSGRCEVRYRGTSSTGIRRMKTNCIRDITTSHRIRPEEPLQGSAQSYRSTDYEFFPDGSIQKIESRDYFHIALQANREIGGSIDSIVVLKSNEHVATDTASVVNGKSIKEFLSSLKNYKSQQLETVAQSIETSTNHNIKQAIKEYEKSLSTSSIGTVQSAKAFLNILPIARVARKEDIIELLKSKKLAKIKVCD